MDLSAILRALVGGALIGLAASLALFTHGRIAGISGTLARAFAAYGGRAFRLPFLAGLLVVGVITGVVAPAALGAPIAGLPTLALAGLLVGVGTTVGSGCTSGHGVCGLSRGSARSLAAVVTLIATGALTVALMGALS